MPNETAPQNHTGDDDGGNDHHADPADINASANTTKHAINFGSATPPPISPSETFKGRGGVWKCEFCSKSVVLPPETKQWKCRQCQRTMYTFPKDECPLDTFCPCCCWDAMLTRP